MTGWSCGIDTGGTFTDLYARHTTGRVVTHKLPSTPANPADAIVAGMEALLERAGISPADIESLSHGTTVATNALIQRRGGKVALITTAGFRDLLEIGRQVRPRIYDLQADYPPPLVPRHLRFEARERVTSGPKILTQLEPCEISRLVEQIRTAGVEACAVCLLFSYAYPDHELVLRRALLEAMPDLHVSLSHEVQPEFREYERLSATVLNAYLQPVMERYLEDLQRWISVRLPGVCLGIHQSSGGLLSVGRARALPVRTALSGPAAGIAGIVRLMREAREPNVITLDMGGTSADICLIRNYAAGITYERWIEGYPTRLPSVNVTAIGAGGGSIAWTDGAGFLKVGPQSAGANPGPACYSRGGTLPTVSDANALLGRLSPEGLLGGRMPLDMAAAHTVISQLADQLGLAPEKTAAGILDVVVANMARAVRTVSVEQGHDPRRYTLVPFGGAGPLHAVAVARALGIRRVLVPLYPGLLCAQGLVVSDPREYFTVTSPALLTEDGLGQARAVLDRLLREAERWLDDSGVIRQERQLEIQLDMRYTGQNYELRVPVAAASEIDLPRLRADFHSEHDRLYGFHDDSGRIEIVSYRVAAGRERPLDEVSPTVGTTAAPMAHRRRMVSFHGVDPVETSLYDRASLEAGSRIEGPAVIDQLDTTTVLFPGDRAYIDGRLNIVIDVGD